MTNPTSVLVVSTSATITPLLRSLLGEGLMVRLVGTARDARLPSGYPPPSIIVFEDANGDASTLRQCAVLADQCSVPVVVWSDPLTESQRCAAALLGNCEVLAPGLDISGVVEQTLEHIRELGRSTVQQLDFNDRAATPEITLDERHRTMRVGAISLPITRTETALLRALLARENVVWRREELIATVWGPAWFGAANVLDTHVLNLRTKLRNAGAAAEIRTVWGVGYLLTERALTTSVAS